MTDINPMRHEPIFNPATFYQPVHIIGAGATGSRLWLALVELGVSNISIYDYDRVESHNIANQIYNHLDVGTAKVEALKNHYYLKTGVAPPEDRMAFHNIKVTSNSIRDLSGIVFILTDTMASRREIYGAYCLSNPRVSRVIETRMASTHGAVYNVDPNNSAQSKAWLASLVEDDAPGETSACGAGISVGPTASLIANLAVWQFILSHTDPVGMNTLVEAYFKPLIVTPTELI